MTPELDAARERDRLRGLLSDARAQLEQERQGKLEAEAQAQQESRMRQRAQAQLSASYTPRRLCELRGAVR